MTKRLTGPELPGSNWPDATPRANLTDQEIRRALRSQTRRPNLSPTDLIVEEVRLWRGYVRADYVIGSTEAIEVIEIKSDRDSLRRFDEQIRVYSSFADHVQLIVGWTLAARALRVAPRWWEVWLAERRSDGSVDFIPLRDGRRNPYPDAMSLARMLPVDAARRALRSVGLEERLSRMTTAELRGVLIAQFSIAELRRLVLEWLRRLANGRNNLAATALVENSIE